jgi:hypothetical protein
MFSLFIECHIEIEKCTNYFFADMVQVISATVVGKKYDGDGMHYGRLADDITN